MHWRHHETTRTNWFLVCSEEEKPGIFSFGSLNSLKADFNQSPEFRKISKSCCEYKGCDSSTLENHILSAEVHTKKEPDDKNAESNESKCEAMDTLETLTNENVGTSDGSNVAADNFSLPNELHGPESLPNYCESSHSTTTKCESKEKA
ncbi:hypothetical protein AVEN_229609-1 [Araneus ventricosus]|uniref:Uncharacterized protein n=1 Tax=Araneus ventricosus TaxID=182803 RepID=A0A4Y2DC08_ARAVE|nr:hypothetical protein AVEN_229609-1 [Araneus ventricosus]